MESGLELCERTVVRTNSEGETARDEAFPRLLRQFRSQSWSRNKVPRYLGLYLYAR